LHLLDSHDRGDIDDDAGIGERRDHRPGEGAFGGGDRDFHVHVRRPGSDDAALRDHLVEIVGEHFKRDRTVRYRFDQFAGEGLVIVDAGLTHQGRVGGETLDQRVLVQRQNAVQVGAIGENLDLFDDAHRLLLKRQEKHAKKNYSAAAATGGDATDDPSL